MEHIAAALTHGLDIGMTIVGVILALFLFGAIVVGIGAALGYVFGEREEEEEPEVKRHEH